MILNIICFIFLLKSSVANKNTVPVFIIDQDKALDHIQIDSNPFEKISPARFMNIVQETMKHSKSIIIFVEDTLSVEDITQKDKHGSPYKYVHQSIKEKKAKYLPSVIEPYTSITHMFPPLDYNVFFLKPRKKIVLIDTFKYIYIYFKDNTNETRIETMRRHDMIIKEVYHAVMQLKPGPITVFYTGKSNPVFMEKLESIPITPNPIPKDLGVMISSPRALFKFTGVYSASPTRRAMFNQLPVISKEAWTRRSMATKMAYTDFELEFNFSFRDYGWTLDDVVLLEAGEEVGRTDMRVGAPWNRSYFCAEPLVILNTRDNSVVTITKYKIQPRTKFLRYEWADADIGGDAGDNAGGDASVDTGGDVGGDSGGSTESFDPSISCGKFVSPGILSGLLVTFVCLLILGFGVVFIMEIHTNDRYEDPQSKPMLHPES